MKIRLQHVVIGIGLILLMTFLFIKTNVIETAAHNRFSQHLRHLRALDATLDKDILESRYGLQTNYDLLITETGKINDLQKELKTVPGFLELDAQERINNLLNEFSDLQGQKELLIERFKSRNEIINNSLRYFPIATSNLIKNAPANRLGQKEIETLNYLQRDVLGYYLLSDTGLEHAIADQIALLEERQKESAPKVDEKALEITISHARTILKLKPEVDDLVKQIVSLPTANKVEQLIALYDSYFDESLRRANIYRLFLYILSVVLLAYIAFIIVRLKKATSELEQDIVERKRTLAEREVISEIIQGVVSTANLDELLQLIYRSIGKVIYAENCFVALYNPKTEMLDIQFWVDKYDPAPPPFKMGRGFAAYICRTERAMIMTPKIIDQLLKQGEIEFQGTAPAIWLGVPLKTSAGIIGVLAVQHYEDKEAYCLRDLELLVAVGDQIALAIERKRVEEALRISEEQHRHLFETNPQPAFVYDLETLDFLAVNDAAVRHYGYSRKEFLSVISLRNLRPAEDLPELIDRVSRVIPEQDTISAPSRHRKKNGMVIDVEITSHVLVFKDRRAEIVLVHDVTERRRLEAESTVISEIIQGVTSTANLDELFHLAHRSIGKVLYAENCYVALYDAETDLLSVVFCVDKYDEPAPPAKLGTGLTAYVLRKNRPMLMTTDVIHRLSENGDIAIVGTNPAIWLGVPLRTPEGIIGALVVQHYENPEAYNQRDVGFLGSIGDQMALAIERKRAEKAVRENEEKYRELFENANDIIYTLDLSGGFTSLNRAGEAITGYSRAEAVQMGIADVIDPKDIAIVRDRIAQNIKGAELSNFELEIIAKNKRKVTMDISSRLILQNGVPVGIQGIGRDITERKQAEQKLRESEEWMRTIFDGSRDGIIIEDKGAIVYANKSFAKLFGYDGPEEVVGKLDTNFLPSEELERMVEFGRRRLLNLDAPSVYEFKGKRKDEMLVEMEAAVSTSVVGGKKYIMTAIRDITERLEARHELERFNEKLQQSNRELQDFAYVASHDLQEPLRKVQAFSDRLKTKYADKLEGEGLDYLERMRSAANRMQLLIQDLLTFSRVSTKVQPFISVDLKTVTQEVLSDLEIKIEESGATIELKDLPTIDADPMQMRQLIQNLVGNALKFRQKNTAPHISISAGPVESNGNGLSGHIQISVQDNGIGFDEKYTDKIFAVFQRLHGRTEYEGSGVGLAICRKIVERHNGKIVAHSIPGGGSTFVVTIPIRQSVGELN